jgi:hypothetical protein
VKRKLLVREGVESNPGPPSVGQTLEWYEVIKRLSEANIKSEALKFFTLSRENKKQFKKALEKQFLHFKIV